MRIRERRNTIDAYVGITPKLAAKANSQLPKRDRRAHVTPSTPEGGLAARQRAGGLAGVLEEAAPVLERACRF